jgi:hypothetical protein
MRYLGVRRKGEEHEIPKGERNGRGYEIPKGQEERQGA